MHLQLHVVETWRAITDLNMERRRWFHDWKENADKQIKQRNKIGDFLMCTIICRSGFQLGRSGPSASKQLRGWPTECLAA